MPAYKNVCNIHSYHSYNKAPVYSIYRHMANMTYKHSNIKHKLLRSTAYILYNYASSYINKCFGADFLSLGFLRVKSTNLFGIPHNLEHFIYSCDCFVLPTSALVHQHPPKQPEHFPNNTWWNLTSTLWPTNGALLIHHHVKIGQLRFIKPLILCLPTAQQLKRITFPPTKTSI